MTFATARAPDASRAATAAELEVWRVRVDASPAAFEASLRMLDEDERRRAAHFRQAADLTRYVLGRGSLRRLISMRLNIPNEGLVFGTNPFGKPCLLKTHPELHFNSSGSGAWILHALDALAPVGVDVEAVRPDFARVDEFAAAFSPEERFEIDRVPLEDRALALARAWVRKEAYVKAIGEGISRSLSLISIRAAATGEPCLLYDCNAPTPLRWSFEDIPVDASHVACFVYYAGDSESGGQRRPVVKDFEKRSLLS